ncbi:hypothetical protein [Xanthomonas translucens]|uniref:hypothetical protein n=1 Tax=Xanthomonas campestris pv. translucens TaxID=343 RepID=UPI0002A7A263|nr:hypothetical protein [Xanthomonas translucens]ELP98017.1 hypothetical protein A989_17858 [Xanthomonas translucens DAR61454]MBC3972047.1 hypothetical protein [Xanthomonas translucens pv. undulosa]MCT8281303.1 hypothetical protein [Xanthomonas translucens pv. undulosa]MCT8316160.1 hypothetical protein [Xanthomonas translucens pv. undulosa]QSQ55377.1 hypothetical protein ISN37_12980 [Xanthomonas translucens pv. undulosa]
MKRSLLVACALLAGPAMAQTSADAGSGSSDREAAKRALDLSVPQQPITYGSDPVYKADPPGAYYGDTSGTSASAQKASATHAVAEAEQARADRCKGDVHGSVATGFGYSSRGGNSNYQAANLNLCKTYYNDDGKPREVGISISVGQSEGHGGYYGRGGYGYPYGGW